MNSRYVGWYVLAVVAIVVALIGFRASMGSGGWSAAIVAIELLTLTGMAVAVLVRRRRRRRYRVMAASSNHPAVRGRRLIEESAIVRDRLSGRIDAHTYRVRMFDLVSHQQFSPRRGLDVER